jgi:hypothetical protein
MENRCQGSWSADRDLKAGSSKCEAWVLAMVSKYSFSSHHQIARFMVTAKS